MDQPNPLVVLFRQYLVYEKGLLPKSVEAYLHDVTLLADFLGDKPLDQAQLEDLQAFLKHLYEQGMAGKGVLASVFQNKVALRVEYAFGCTVRSQAKNAVR